jgi:hypothetical protein
MIVVTECDDQRNENVRNSLYFHGGYIVEATVDKNERFEKD